MVIFNACGSFLKMTSEPTDWITAIATVNTARVFMTAKFKSAVGRVTALALNLESTFFKMYL